MNALVFSHGLKFVYLDGCVTGRLYIASDNTLQEVPKYGGVPYPPPLSESDMSWALKMIGGVYDQFYQSWWGDIHKGEATPFNAFAVHEWGQLQEGEDLYTALQYAVTETGKRPDGEEALDNLRVYGMGLMSAVRIE